MPCPSRRCRTPLAQEKGAERLAQEKGAERLAQEKGAERPYVAGYDPRTLKERVRRFNSSNAVTSCLSVRCPESSA
jgi:hypothetical protein